MLKSVLAVSTALAVGMISHEAKAQEVETTTVDEVIVTGVRASLARARDIKRDATGVIDVIVAEDIAKFPDQNLGEALQRITGVQLTREVGEGRQISVRGLAPGFTQVLVNGATAVNGNSGREFDFDVFASELFTRVEVIKSPSAALDEGGVAATIQLNTARPFDFPNPVLAASVQGSYGELADVVDPRASFLISHRFMDGKAGILVSGAYSEATLRQDGASTVSWEARNFDLDRNGVAEFQNVFIPRVPRSELEYRERERLGLTASLEFRPTDNLRFSLDGVFAAFDENRERYSMDGVLRVASVIPQQLTVVDGTVVAGRFTNVDLRSETVHDITQSEFAQLVARGKWEGDNWTVSGLLAHSEAFEQAPLNVRYLISGRGDFAYDVRNNNAYPSMGSTTFGYLDPSQYFLNQVRFDRFENEDQESAAQFDVRRSLDWGALSGFSAGLKWKTREKSRDAALFNQNPAVVTRVGAYAVPLPFENYADSLPGAEGLVARWLVADTVSARAALVPAGYRPPANRQDSFTVTEDVYAGYVQADFSGVVGPFDYRADLGVRIVETRQTSEGFRQEGTVTTPVSISQDYTDILPAANLRFDLTNSLVLRLAAAKVMTRPTLTDISPRQSIDLFGLRVTRGNPRLEPFRASQFDASLEWYFGTDSLLSVTAFKKDISSFVTSVTTTERLTGLTVPRDNGVIPNGELFTVSTPVNGDGAEVTGLEFAYQQTFDFLPGPFGGLGLLANFTLAESEAVFTQGAITRTFAFPGQSRTSYNIVGFYEKYGFNLRVAYNYRDEYVLTPFIEGNSTGIVDAYGQVDFSAGYDVNDHVSVTIEGLNVTDEDVYQYATEPNRLWVAGASGPRYVFGVRAKF